MSSKRRRTSKSNRANQHGSIDVPVKDDVMVEKESGITNQIGINVSWEREKGMFYPFYADGAGEGDMIESAIKGTVVDAFLSNRALSHTISINVDNDSEDRIQECVRT